MHSLYQKFEALLQHTATDMKRYLYDKISWDSRMIGIVGPRGVGKTTMVLQFIKEKLDSKRALYISADDLYFGENRLYDVANSFYMSAGEYLIIDEIHKYQDWSRELKNMYDAFPSLKIVFTGSSVLDILKGSADLSRRALVYTLQGLSFREYLTLYHGYNAGVYTLEQIIHHEPCLPDIPHPLPFFRDYLKRGYYPFGLEGELNLRLGQIIVQTLESDIPYYANLSVGTSRKLKHLLSILAESVPFKPNFSKISDIIGVSRNSLDDYFYFMEKAGLISQLRSDIGGIRGLGKVNKVYLDNTNLMVHLLEDRSDIGSMRETFFYNQMRVHHQVTSSEKVDFKVDQYNFEVGGKSKKLKQLPNDDLSFVVKDDIEYGYQNIIPLWAFGLTY